VKKEDLVHDQSKCGVCEQILNNPVSINCGHNFCKQCISCYRVKTSESENCPQCIKICRTLPVLHSQKEVGGSSTITQIQQEKDSALQPHTLLEETDDILQRVKDKHKTSMKNKYRSVFEGIKQEDNQTLLNRIYTQLYIIEGESKGVNEEHEVLQMEQMYRKQQGTSIICNDIFKTVTGYEEERKEKGFLYTKCV